MRAQIAEDLRQHVDERHTPHLGAFVAMLSVYAEVGRLAEVLSVRSRAVDMSRWQSFFNSVASGPPGFRVRELLALARAGYVRFLGPGMEVEIADGAFRATLGAIPEAVTADVLVDARLPDPSASRSCDPLVGGAHARRRRRARRCCATSTAPCCATPASCGCGPPTARSSTRPGAVHPRRFAIGPHTTVRVAGAFTRPGMNAQSLRYNDAVARAVLRALAAEVAAAAAA